MWIILRGDFLKSYLVSFCSYVFQSFSIAITSLGEERAKLSAFRTFVRYVLVWLCLFPLPLGVWEGLRLVIVAPFLYICYKMYCCGGRPLQCTNNNCSDDKEIQNGMV